MCSRERLSFFGRLSDALLNEQQLVAALRSELAERTRAALSDKTAQVSTTKENDFGFDLFFCCKKKVAQAGRGVPELNKNEAVAREREIERLTAEVARLGTLLGGKVSCFVLSFFFSLLTLFQKGQDDCRSQYSSCRIARSERSCDFRQTG